jgi:environmental stress-induced protein Ves
LDELSILRARDRREMPWKNGGGLTSEVIVSPAGANFDTFDWRISIAAIQTNGPFSELPGIDRRLVLLEGLLALRIQQEAPVELSPNGPPIVFAGELPAYAELVAGPVTDLNVMTRRGRFRSSIEAHTLSAPVTFHNNEVSTVLIATGLVDIEYQGVEHKLQPRDAVLLRGESAARLASRAAPAIVYVIEIAAIQPDG